MAPSVADEPREDGTGASAVGVEPVVEGTTSSVVTVEPPEDGMDRGRFSRGCGLEL